MEEQRRIERDTLRIDIAILEKAFTTGLPCHVEEGIKEHISELKKQLKATQYNERTFSNKDFKVTVWEDSERIGIKDIWVREEFEYRGEEFNSCAGLEISSTNGTYLYRDELPLIGCGTGSQAREKNRLGAYTYADIVNELEKADKLSKEADIVSVYDVMLTLDETKTITDLFKALSNYEFKRLDKPSSGWSAMRFVEIEKIISEPNDYQLRRRETE